MRAARISADFTQLAKKFALIRAAKHPFYPRAIGRQLTKWFYKKALALLLT
jgi:hypothetical protein